MPEIATANYEMKRQARGAEPPRRNRPCARRLIGAGAAVVVLFGAVVGYFVWQRFTRVFLLDARIMAATVALAPVADGRLQTLLVAEGERVARGQVLARLDAPEAQAELAAAARIAAARMAGARAAAAARRARLTDEIRAAEARWRESQAALRRLKDGARPEDIQAAAARLDAARAQLALYHMELDQSRKLATQGIDSQHLLEVRRTQVLTQEKTVEQARLEWERLKAGPTAAELDAAEQAVSAREAEQALARAGRHDVAALEAEQCVREEEHAEAAARLREAGARRAGVTDPGPAPAAEAGSEGPDALLENRDLVSPVDGVVIRLFRRVGEVCSRGAPCLLVADARQPRWIEGFVREEDALRIRVGQTAWVRLPVGSGAPLEAVVEQVRLHTEAASGNEAAGVAPAAAPPARVGVRIRLIEPLPDDLPTGLSAEVAVLVYSAPRPEHAPGEQGSAVGLAAGSREARKTAPRSM